jgi:hypothetical protein
MSADLFAEARRISMKFVALLLALQGLPPLLAIACAFVLKRRGRSGKRRRGFYPTTFALGIAFQQIQLFVAPSTEYTIAEKLREEAENDDDGGPDNSAKHLDRQLRRIRRGERIEVLTTMLPNRD